MKILPAALMTIIALTGCAPTNRETPMSASTITSTATDQSVVIDLSRQKWQWMADRKMEELERLFHLSARFVHMGATMNRQAELDVIRGGQIQYKHAEISETSAEVIGDTAIVYSKLQLLAVVGGNEITNPFSVTETFVRGRGHWQLAAMSFTRLLGE